MALEVWTVLWDVKSEGNLAPAGTWAQKKMKVVNAAGETKEKNNSYANVPAGGVVKTSQVQSAKLVSVEAESAEEAVLAVKKFYAVSSGGGTAGSGGVGQTQAEMWETASSLLTGPRSNTAFTGKQAAGVLTEVTVL